jgi:hypothetical protein
MEKSKTIADSRQAKPVMEPTVPLLLNGPWLVSNCTAMGRSVLSRSCFT